MEKEKIEYSQSFVKKIEQLFKEKKFNEIFDMLNSITSEDRYKFFNYVVHPSSRHEINNACDIFNMFVVRFIK